MAGLGSIADDEHWRSRIQKLEDLLEVRRQEHAENIAGLRKEVERLKSQLAATADEISFQEASEDPFVRQVEWTIKGMASTLSNTAKNKSLFSPEFSVLGVHGFQLEFFPSGTESTSRHGYCAVFLWCPAGITIKYELRVGSHRAPPDEDVYLTRIAHGHSDFCFLETQIDRGTDSLVIGLEVLNLCVERQVADGVTLFNGGPEKLIAQEAQVLHNHNFDSVRWRIKNIRQRAKEVLKGFSICSPIFSVAGVREMFIELYPNGVPASTSTANHCGLYVRCSAASSLTLSLSIGSVTKGPIQAEFDGKNGRGLPEFCDLQHVVPNYEEDLIITIAIKNNRLLDSGPMELWSSEWK